MPDLALSCRCGEVTGKITSVTPKSGNRIICYCSDCQAFSNYLDPNSQTLNDFGGTEIFQVPPSQLEIRKGIEHVACLRLSPKGLYRWYTSCCNTPIGNTVAASWPFVGVIHSFFKESQNIAEKIGPVLGSVHMKEAKSTIPEHIKGPNSERSIMLRVLKKLLIWKVLGKGRPNPLFTDEGKTIKEPVVLNKLSVG